jgi:hypothetical protein
MIEDVRRTRKEAVVACCAVIFRPMSSKDPTKDNHQNPGRNNGSVRRDDNPEPAELEGTITTTP